MTNTKGKEAFLDKHLFHGLTDLNSGFDAGGIRYFSAADFEVVLHRCKDLRVGVYGIEPWEGGEYFGVETLRTTQQILRTRTGI